MFACHLTADRNGFELAVDLEAERDEIIAVVGPNGAGKTTLLRVLAGLDPVRSGTVVVDGRVWDGPGVRLAPEHRSVGYVPQSGLLFPHLSVEENVGFALGPGERAPAREWLERVGLASGGALRPHELSGGQAQLVAFARAMARHPEVLLLDEPLASVDVANRATVRHIIRRGLREGPGFRILVTHDPLEAAALADRLVVLEEGRIVQTGSIEELRDRPRSRYVAELIGLNFFAGQAVAGNITLDNGAVLVSASLIDGPAIATVHPRAISLYAERPSGSPRNVWLGHIAAIEPSLEQVRVHVAGPVDVVAEVTRGGAAPFSEGEGVWVSIKASEVMAYPG
jgi:molybdate transport system ATP-binding protein